MARPAKSISDAQLPLSPTIQDVHRGRASQLRALLQRAITSGAMSLSDLAEETRIDNSQITRMLSGEAGLRLDFLAAVLERDRTGIFIVSLAELLGFDATRKTPDLAAENKRLRAELEAIREGAARSLEATANL
jgi:transcriptional regulator with XRE-family HTH domain